MTVGEPLSGISAVTTSGRRCATLGCICTMAWAQRVAVLHSLPPFRPVHLAGPFISSAVPEFSNLSEESKEKGGFGSHDCCHGYGTAKAQHFQKEEKKKERG